MSMVDDATSTTLIRFGAEETTWAAAVLQAWFAAHGVPRALYTDWKTVDKREPTLNETVRGVDALTQFGRMCQKLDIAIIGAASPQAKGRVERSHGTHQDRGIKKMRLLGIRDDAAANAYATATYLPQHNARFTVAPASAVDHHRVRARHRPDDDVFCLEETRMVGQDYVVQYKTQGLQLDRAARGRVPAKSPVVVRETEDGRVRVIHVGRDGHERLCAWTPAVARATARPAQPRVTNAPAAIVTVAAAAPAGAGPSVAGATPAMGGRAGETSGTRDTPPVIWSIRFPKSITHSPRDNSIRSAKGAFLSALDTTSNRSCTATRKVVL